MLLLNAFTLNKKKRKAYTRELLSSTGDGSLSE